MGIISAVTGFLIDNYALILLGILISMISFANRDTWEKNKTNWKKISREERKISAIIMMLILAVIIIGLASYSLR
ncbi:hypothetical protein HYZ41_00335 [archaeon]|nr:hypothetical protein [archaeon]